MGNNDSGAIGEDNLFSYESGTNINNVLTGKMVVKMNELYLTYQDSSPDAFRKLCEIGRILLEIKGNLSHGQFEDFFRENVSPLFPIQFARRCIRFHKNRDLH